MTSKEKFQLSQKSDEDLVFLVKKGDGTAFDELFERYKAKIFSFVRRYVRDTETAEDIFQKTFIRLYTKAGYFKRESKFSTWLYTIAANLCKDELKKRRFRQHVSLESSTAYGRNGTKIPAPGEKIPSSAPGPRSRAQKNEVSALIRKAVDELPDEFRIVVTLHGLHRLKYREVAEILGIPLGTVQSRMHTAMNKLREKLRRFKPNR